MQLIFNLQEIDRDATKKRVESVLENYRMYLLMDPVELQPKITSTFKLSPPSKTNKFHSDTEHVAIERVDLEIKRRKYINRIQEAVNRLNYEERAAIIKRYLTVDDVYDYEVYNELGYSERKYYRIKSRAFYKLAFILRIEVYKSRGDRV